jgi:hypothetical protein
MRGRDHVTRFLRVFLPVLNDVRTVRHFADGDYVATEWQAETVLVRETAFPISPAVSSQV